MTFKLSKDLCFFDIEATGLSVVRDRIVQIAIIKYLKNGQEPEELSMLINPGIPISAEAMKVHGIQPKDLAKKPTFQQVAQKIFDFIGNADLAGYNSNRYDVPLLMEEFARVGIEFNVDNRRLIDVQRIFYKMEPRTLKAALRYYCAEDLVDAHDAMADVKATVRVLQGQLEKYDGIPYETSDGEILENPVRNDMKALHEFTNDLNTLDATQKLRLNDQKEVVFNFGKYNGQAVGPVLHKDQHYYQWILNKEFSTQVKSMVKKIYSDYKKKLKTNGA